MVMSEYPLMSVKQFARVLIPGGDAAAIAKMMRQVRHWTALDLLCTAGPKATGTGVSRVYDEDELFKAVILEELIRLGVSAAFLHEIEFGEWLEGSKSFDHWQLAKSGEQDVYLHLGSHPDGSSAVTISDDPKRLLSMLYYVKPAPAPIGKLPPMRFSSLIILNIAALFDRVPQ